MRTEEARYAEWRVEQELVWWKRVLDVQRPYRVHLRGLKLGRVLEVGCGIGRNLTALGPTAVGIDHNPRAIQVARDRGLTAYTPDEFLASAHGTAAWYDALLLAHVLEHMSASEAAALLRAYLPYVRAGGTAVVITPQEAGFRSDPTHVEFMDFGRVASVIRQAGLTVTRQYSFPFPRVVGRVFKYNEFVSIAAVGASEQSGPEPGRDPLDQA